LSFFILVKLFFLLLYCFHFSTLHLSGVETNEVLGASTKDNLVFSLSQINNNNRNQRDLYFYSLTQYIRQTKYKR